MPKDTRSIQWLIEQLERERKTFTDQAYPLLTYQKAKIQPYDHLLQESKESLSKGSIQRKSRRTRVRTVLQDIYSVFGVEVFFLCTQATTITELGTVTPAGLLPSIGSWWSGVLHPRGLSIAANETCSHWFGGRITAAISSSSGKNAFAR